jgi:hypothetical protein
VVLSSITEPEGNMYRSPKEQIVAKLGQVQFAPQDIEAKQL